MDQELVELLWQNGKPVVNSIDSRQVPKNFHSSLRISEPFGNSSNLIQEDAWIQYPIEDHLETEFCSPLLPELPPCEVESYKQIKQFEEGKFPNLDPSSAPGFHVSDSSQKKIDYKVLQFSNFTAPPNVSSASGNANFRGKVSCNLSKTELRECSVMTVGSSYCGSNHIPQEQDVSRASSKGGLGTTLSAKHEAGRDDVQGTVLQSEKRKSEMFEPNMTSSSGGSDSSLGKTCSLSTRNLGQKRKGIDAEESEEQSEDTELKSAVRNKASQKAGSSRRNRAAEVHNLSERRRRDRINEKMKALQQLIPHSNKTDKASMLDEAIEYLKSLQLQLQVMWMGSGMTPVMFPGIQHYMSQMGMGMATPSFPSIHNSMQLPRVPHDQSISMSQTPNQTLMCQNPILGAFNYQNQMQNPSLSEQYARFMGYRLMQSSSQPMNAFGYGSQAVQHSQTMIPPSNSNGFMSGKMG